MNKVIQIIIIIILLTVLIYLFRKNSKPRDKVKQSVTKKQKRPYGNIIQTIRDKTNIPRYIHEAFEKYGNGMKREIYDDNDCRRFLSEHFGKKYVDKFDYMVLGCHKADLFRYAYLYIHGGIYMDIKCIPLKDLRSVFYDDSKSFFVDSFNGIIATPPKNALMLECLENLLQYNNKENREVPCIHYLRLIKEYTLDHEYHVGINYTKNDIPIYRYTIHHNPQCGDGEKDRWGFCIQFVENEAGERLIQLRDMKYIPNYNKENKRVLYTFDRENKRYKIE
tara:strand:- start:906 stop:1742 length:837 start_codon:yes stop_codon:yes gene_type:complete